MNHPECESGSILKIKVNGDAELDVVENKHVSTYIEEKLPNRTLKYIPMVSSKIDSKEPYFIVGEEVYKGAKDPLNLKASYLVGCNNNVLKKSLIGEVYVVGRIFDPTMCVTMPTYLNEMVASVLQEKIIMLNESFKPYTEQLNRLNEQYLQQSE